jgi:hypothetical protein
MEELINYGDVAADKFETKAANRSGSIAKSY